MNKHKVDDHVLALWPANGVWYDAKIIGKNKKTYVVKYIEDGIRKTLLPHQISSSNINVKTSSGSSIDDSLTSTQIHKTNLPEDQIEKNNLPEDSLTSTQIDKTNVPEDSLIAGSEQKTNLPEDSLIAGSEQKTNLPEDSLIAGSEENVNLPEDSLIAGSEEKTNLPEDSLIAGSEENVNLPEDSLRTVVLRPHTNIPSGDEVLSSTFADYCQKTEKVQCDSSFDKLVGDKRRSIQKPCSYLQDDDTSDDEVCSSGNEYKPSDESYVSDSDNSVRSEIIPLSQFLSTQERSIRVTESSPVEVSSTTNGRDGSLESGIKIMGTSNDGNIRKWDKKQYCYFCSLPVSKLPRHLTSKHGDEIDVRDLINEKSPLRRYNILHKLRNLGNHKHNSEVIRQNKGTIIVCYRPSKDCVNADDYGPCPYCYGYYVRTDLWRHRCPFKPQKRKLDEICQEETMNKHPKVKERVASKSSLLKPTPNGLSEILKEVLVPMRKDSVGMIVKNDSLILEMGKREFMKVGHDTEQFSYIRCKMRELGRLLLHLRIDTGKPNANLQQFIHPSQFKTIISAVHNVAGFNENTHAFETPSLALKLGHSIKKCSIIMKANALEKNDRESADTAENFYKLCEMKWEIEVSTHALRTLYESKRNNPEIMPTMEDVVTLSNYLKTIGDEEKNKIEHTPDDKKKSWDILNEIILCQVILFNRRRQGEVSKMKLEDFNKKHFTTTGDSILLSEMEKKLCKMFEVVEVVGKRGTTVPLLLTKEATEKINILISHRSEIGVADKNEFLFARSCYQSLGHIRGSDAMRKHSQLSNVKNPASLRFTKLRKHVATAAQMLALKENEVELLATYMGHDIRVHREYYQLPDNVLRVTKLSKLFLAMERGTLKQHQGQSLDDMNVCLSDSGKDYIEDDDDDNDEDNDREDEYDEEDDDEGVREDIERMTKSRNKKPEKKNESKGYKRTWTEDEICAVKSLKNTLYLRLPGKKDIEDAQNKFPILKKRTWRNIKDYCRNNRKKLLN